jgi:hypothetical protein
MEGIQEEVSSQGSRFDMTLRQQLLPKKPRPIRRNKEWGMECPVFEPLIALSLIAMAGLACNVFGDASTSTPEAATAITTKTGAGSSTTTTTTARSPSNSTPAAVPMETGIWSSQQTNDRSLLSGSPTDLCVPSAQVAPFFGPTVQSMRVCSSPWSERPLGSQRVPHVLGTRIPTSAPTEETPKEGKNLRNA